jgi:hypothetical protein
MQRTWSNSVGQQLADWLRKPGGGNDGDDAEDVE